MRYIAISGKKHAGKDSLCEALQKVSAIPTVRVGFADALKKECADVCEISVEQLDADKEFYRPFLQWWGMFRRNTKGEDYWVTRALITINSIKDYSTLVIISDLRLANELYVMRELSAHCVRISRPEQHTEDNHISETALDKVHDWDSIVLNRGTLEDLEKEAREILTKMKVKVK